MAQAAFCAVCINRPWFSEEPEAALGVSTLIKELGKDDIKQALDLVNKVFSEFVAVDYSEQGNKTFNNYLKVKYEEALNDV